MKQFKVTYYTGTIAGENGTSSQDYFSKVVEEENAHELVHNVVETLHRLTFIANDEFTHFYRTSNITDFSIRELEEN